MPWKLVCLGVMPDGRLRIAIDYSILVKQNQVRYTWAERTGQDILS